jgi:hypothetical protein
MKLWLAHKILRVIRWAQAVSRGLDPRQRLWYADTGPFTEEQMDQPWPSKTPHSHSPDSSTSELERGSL